MAVSALQGVGWEAFSGFARRPLYGGGSVMVQFEVSDFRLLLTRFDGLDALLRAVTIALARAELPSDVEAIGNFLIVTVPARSPRVLEDVERVLGPLLAPLVVLWLVYQLPLPRAAALYPSSHDVWVEQLGTGGDYAQVTAVRPLTSIRLFVAGVVPFSEAEVALKDASGNVLAEFQVPANAVGNAWYVIQAPTQEGMYTVEALGAVLFPAPYFHTVTALLEVSLDAPEQPETEGSFFDQVKGFIVVGAVAIGAIALIPIVATYLPKRRERVS